MEDLQRMSAVGRTAIFGSLSAVLGLLTYDIAVAIFHTATFGSATLGAGGALAPLSKNLGIRQILLAVVLLAFSGYLGGVVVGHSPLRRLNPQVRSQLRTIVNSAALGAIAVGVGSLWLVVVPPGIAILLGSSMGNVPLAQAGYFVIGLLGGSIFGVASIVWPLRNVGEGLEPPALENLLRTRVGALFLRPITVLMAMSWLVVPGLLMAAAAVDPGVSEIVISVSGSLFFGFWAAFAAIVTLEDKSKDPAKATISMVGFPAGAVAALLGNSICHSVGSGSLAGAAASSSPAGLFLFLLSGSIGAFAGLFGAPIASMLLDVVRRERMPMDGKGRGDASLLPTTFRSIVLVGLFLVLISVSVAARFHVESGERLVNSAFEGNLNTAGRSLAVGADPNHQSPTGWTPLSAAVEKNRPAFVHLLLRAGADPGNPGRTQSLLFRAAELGSAKIVAALLGAGADPNEAVFRGARPIEVGAADFQVVRLLLEAGADPDDQNGRSSLGYAISHGNPEGAQLMLAAGADPDPKVRSPRGTTIYLAAERGYPDLLNNLIERGATFDWGSDDAQTLLATNAARGKTDVVAILIDQGVDMNASLSVHAALAKSHQETAIHMIEEGADVHLTDERGRTPLHLAAHRGLLAAAGVLLNHGADINAVTAVGDTPLHFICGGGGDSLKREMIEFLLSRGADLQIRNEGRQTAYDESTTYEKKIIDEFQDAHLLPPN